MSTSDIKIDSWRHHQPLKVALGCTGIGFMENKTILRTSTKVYRETVAKFENDEIFAVAYKVCPNVKEGQLSRFHNTREFSDDLLEHEEIMQKIIETSSVVLYNDIHSNKELYVDINKEQVWALLGLDNNYPVLKEDEFLWIWAGPRSIEEEDE